MNGVNAASSQPANGFGQERIGSIELGCFKLTEVIGKGSYGTSYLAQQIGFDRAVVVKVAHAELFQSRNAEVARRRFADELRAATRVQHPHLVTLYTAGETADGVPAIAMELAPGDPLEDLLGAHPHGLPGALVAEAFRQLGSAIAALHDAGVVHRDLSPANVMLDSGPPVKVKVLDFGVAKLRGRPRHTFGTVGTPRYMAPEQVIGQAIPASDVFALGAMLWWALTGHEYRNEIFTIEDLHHAALTDGPAADPRSLAPSIPPAIAELTSRMLAQHDDERPTAAEFCERWDAVAEQLRTYNPGPLSAIDPAPISKDQATVSMPPGYRVRPGGSSPETWAQPPLKKSRGPRVLVVDANPITQHLLIGCLRRAGCQVRGTNNPRDATRAAANTFDLVLLSTEIHDAPPLEIAHHLHEHHPEQWIVLAGSGALDARHKRAGIRDLVSVPTGFSRLAELVDDLRSELAIRESSKPTDIEAIDRSVLDQLHATDPTVVREAIELFVGQTPESLALIAEFHAQGAIKQVSSECQSLSASAKALGANHLARLAYAAAELVRDGDMDCVPGFVTEMEREYSLVFRSLMNFRSNAHTDGSSR